MSDFYKYAEREYDLVYADLRDLITEREYVEGRALAFLGFGYIDHALRWWRYLRRIA